jgi:hypothetical protein
MRILLPLLLVSTLVGCAGNNTSTSISPVSNYQGPQNWPLGWGTIDGPKIHNAPVMYGLPHQPYKVLQIVRVNRQNQNNPEELEALSHALARTRPDALVLIGTRYDRNLEVDEHLTKSRNVHPDCLKTVYNIRANNADATSEDVVFLAVRFYTPRWTTGQTPRKTQPWWHSDQPVAPPRTAWNSVQPGNQPKIKPTNEQFANRIAHPGDAPYSAYTTRPFERRQPKPNTQARVQ